VLLLVHALARHPVRQEGPATPRSSLATIALPASPGTFFFILSSSSFRFFFFDPHYKFL
jgi:hypothetical protein